MLSKEMFQERITIDNPWWADGTIPEGPSGVGPRPAMDAFFPLVCQRDLHRAVVLIGPRRVGKTYLIYHVIGRLLGQRQVPPGHIVYLPIDTPVYQGIGLEELLTETSRRTGANPKTDDMFVFFDEIQYLRDWEVHLKSLVDTYPRVKFVVSGSAAASLKKGSGESGAGRFTDFHLPPLSFYEYVYLLGKTAVFAEAPALQDEAAATPPGWDVNVANRLFCDYLNYGGYPELLASSSVRADPGRYIQQDIVDKVLLRDLPSLYHVSDIRELQLFFSYLAFHSGEPQSYEALSQNAGVPKHAIGSYLDYLEAAYLVNRLDRIDVSARKFRRATQFKVYLSNPSLRRALFKAVQPDDAYMGYAVETAISAQFGIGETRALLRYANWQSGRNQGEVDFVMLDPAAQRPQSALEVKWSNSAFEHPAELKSLGAFAVKNNLQSAWITTRTACGRKQVQGCTYQFLPNSAMAWLLGAPGNQLGLDFPKDSD